MLFGHDLFVLPWEEHDGVSLTRAVEPLVESVLKSGGELVVLSEYAMTSVNRAIAPNRLLADAGIGGLAREPASVDARGAEAPADWDSLKSPENYVGHARTENFASPGGAGSGTRRVYAAPAQLRLNHWALVGDWTMEKEATVLNKGNGRIAYRFHARDLHLVMGPVARGSAVRFRVLIDGQPPGAAHGIDVDEQGNGTVTEQRLYQLIRQPKPIADRRFEIEFLDPGVEAFAFTFG